MDLRSQSVTSQSVTQTPAGLCTSRQAGGRAAFTGGGGHLSVLPCRQDSPRCGGGGADARAPAGTLLIGSIFLDGGKKTTEWGRGTSDLDQRREGIIPKNGEAVVLAFFLSLCPSGRLF